MDRSLFADTDTQASIGNAIIIKVHLHLVPYRTRCIDDGTWQNASFNLFLNTHLFSLRWFSCGTVPFKSRNEEIVWNKTVPCVFSWTFCMQDSLAFWMIAKLKTHRTGLFASLMLFSFCRNAAVTMNQAKAIEQSKAEMHEHIGIILMPNKFLRMAAGFCWGAQRTENTARPARQGLRYTSLLYKVGFPLPIPHFVHSTIPIIIPIARASKNEAWSLLSKAPPDPKSWNCQLESYACAIVRYILNFFPSRAMRYKQ